MEHLFSNGQKLEILQGDITQQQVDAIVNAANQNLLHGGGVASTILRKGGPTIQRESERWVAEHGPVNHANPAYTSAGDLPCKYVIHAVGPMWGQGLEHARLAATVHASLRLAESLGLHSLALPAISTGIFGFPVDQAAQVILDSIGGYYDQNPTSPLILIRLVLFDLPTLQVFETTLMNWKEKPSSRHDHINP